MTEAQNASFAPHYEDEQVTIYHGDCLDVLARVPEVDAVLTDPPYNVGKKYGEHDDRMNSADYLDWLADRLSMASLCLSARGFAGVVLAGLSGG